MNLMNRNPPVHHRRDILRTCLRCAALLTLGGTAARLGSRGFNQNCVRTQPCGGCPLFSGCSLPKARDAKPPARNAPAHHA